jgi:F-type H+-transporting ATPase subunit epsilon
MAATFNFELVSPERVLFSGDASDAVLPGVEGDFQVLPGHAPMVSTLRPGIVEVTVEGAKRRVFVKGGFAEVDPERATVLAETAIDLAQRDPGRVSAELTAAEAWLADAKDDETRMMAGLAVDHLRQIQSAG